MSPTEKTRKSMRGVCSTKEDGHINRKIFDATAVAIVYNQDGVSQGWNKGIVPISAYIHAK